MLRSSGTNSHQNSTKLVHRDRQSMQPFASWTFVPDDSITFIAIHVWQGIVLLSETTEFSVVQLLALIVISGEIETNLENQ